MDQATITSETRRWLQQIKALSVSDTDIANMTIRGVKQLWLMLKAADPDFVRRRTSISSTTNIFALPSDCMTVNRVWNMLTTAGSVEATSNVGGEVNIQITAHGFSDDDNITLHDVGGTTEANGTWNISKVDADNFTLDGSTYANAWTSGGKAFEEKSTFTQIFKINSNKRRGVNDDRWFLQGKNIVVDQLSFAYDIVIDYEARPSAVTDIPEEYHEGLISFCFLQFLPQARKPKDQIEANDRQYAINFHREVWTNTINSIQTTFDLSTEPEQMGDGVDWNLID